MAFRAGDHQRGSVFTVLLGAVAMTGALSLMLYQQISGPMATAARMAKKSMADTQMLSVARIAIMDAAGSGDCDSDGQIEPREWRDTAGAKPTNAGLIPSTIGAPVQDPWGTDYGYCVWDVGAQNDPVTDNGCGANTKRLAGTTNVGAGSNVTRTVLAVVSAGADRQFQTTCSAYVDATTDTITTTGDDIVLRYSYSEAAATASDLWILKTGAPTVATIAKDLEVTGTGLITATAANFTGKVIATGGTKVGTDAAVTTCNAANKGLIRFNDTSKTLEVCDGDAVTPTWQAAGSGGGGSGLWTENPGDTDEIYYSTDNVGVGVTDPVTKLHVAGTMIIGTDATACAAGTKGAIQWDDTDKTFQMCDGTDWRNLMSEPSTGSTPVSGAGNGYFVMTATTTDGAMNGMEGANRLCLEDLQTYDWMGKADALSRGMVNSTYVHAWVCNANGCNDPFLSTRYYFALANSPAVGGAYFDTGTAGEAPNNDDDWTGATYFGGAYSYWTNRSAGASTTVWSLDPYGTCTHLTTNHSVVTSRRGTSGTGAGRWNDGVSSNCNPLYRLICLVHPSPVGTPADPPIAPGASDGYFVYTKTTYNGNLGGLAGADAACLTDLTTYDWTNKATATANNLLTSSNVRALLCDDGNCNQLNASTRYFFAVSDNLALGGAHLIASSAGLGPNSLMNWSTTDRFGASGLYWSGKLQMDAGSSSRMFWRVSGDTGNNCVNWTSTAGTGRTGTPASAIHTRWVNTSPSCASTLGLICIVHPRASGTGCGLTSGTYSVGNTQTTVTVPAGCPATFKAWGGGGGSGMPHASYGSGRGGGGGYAVIVIPAQASAVTYYLVVGDGGAKGGACGAGGGAGGSSIASYGGGTGGGGTCPGGGGGSASSVWTGGYGTTPVIVAAGGGGGGAGIAAAAGYNAGAGGQAGSGTGATTAGTNASWGNSGGGGSGYPKGGINGGSNTIGGAGGANYAASGGSTVAGSSDNVGNTGDPNKPAGAGKGGNSLLGATQTGENGNDGAIYYSY